jgi:hypothetical protein
MRNTSLGCPRQNAVANRQMARSGTFLFCTSRQWNIPALSGLLADGVSWPWYGQVSGWIGVVRFPMTTILVVARSPYLTETVVQKD